MQKYFSLKYFETKWLNVILHRAFVIFVLFITFAVSSAAPAPPAPPDADQTCNFVNGSISPIVATYSPIDILTRNTADTTTASFSVRCTFPKGPAGNQPMTVCAQIGANSDATLSDATSRYLKKDANSVIAHQLYTDNTYGVVWGSWGVGGSSAYPPSGPNKNSGATQYATNMQPTVTFTIYGATSANPQRNPISSALNTAGTYSWTLNPGIIVYYFSGNKKSCATAAAGPAKDYTVLPWQPTLIFKVTVNAGCYISGSSNPLVTQDISIDFGSVTSIAADMTKAGNMYVQCTNGTSYIIGMGNGNSATGSGATLQRRLSNGKYFINYGLYTDSAYKIPWANVVTGSVACSITGNCLSGTATGAAVQLPVYVKIPFQTTPTPGTYTDTVVVTINY